MPPQVQLLMRKESAALDLISKRSKTEKYLDPKETWNLIVTLSRDKTIDPGVRKILGEGVRLVNKLLPDKPEEAYKAQNKIYQKILTEIKEGATEYKDNQKLEKKWGNKLAVAEKNLLPSSEREALVKLYGKPYMLLYEKAIITVPDLLGYEYTGVKGKIRDYEGKTKERYEFKVAAFYTWLATQFRYSDTPEGTAEANLEAEKLIGDLGRKRYLLLSPEIHKVMVTKRPLTKLASEILKENSYYKKLLVDKERLEDELVMLVTEEKELRRIIEAAWLKKFKKAPTLVTWKRLTPKEKKAIKELVRDQYENWVKDLIDAGILEKRPSLEEILATIRDKKSERRDKLNKVRRELTWIIENADNCAFRHRTFEKLEKHYTMAAKEHPERYQEYAKSANWAKKRKEDAQKGIAELRQPEALKPKVEPTFNFTYSKDEEGKDILGGIQLGWSLSRGRNKLSLYWNYNIGNKTLSTHVGYRTRDVYALYSSVPRRKYLTLGFGPSHLILRRFGTFSRVTYEEYRRPSAWFNFDLTAKNFKEKLESAKVRWPVGIYPTFVVPSIGYKLVNFKDKRINPGIGLLFRGSDKETFYEVKYENSYDQGKLVDYTKALFRKKLDPISKKFAITINNTKIPLFPFDPERRYDIYLEHEKIGTEKKTSISIGAPF